MDMRCILTALFSSEQFRSRFLLRLEDAIHNYFSGEQILPLMEEYEELLREEVSIDHQAWTIPMGRWVTSTSRLRVQLTDDERWINMLKTLKSFPHMADEDLTWLLLNAS